MKKTLSLAVTVIVLPVLAGSSTVQGSTTGAIIIAAYGAILLFVLTNSVRNSVAIGKNKQKGETLEEMFRNWTIESREERARTHAYEKETQGMVQELSRLFAQFRSEFDTNMRDAKTLRHLVDKVDRNDDLQQKDLDLLMDAIMFGNVEKFYEILSRQFKERKNGK